MDRRSFHVELVVSLLWAPPSLSIRVATRQAFMNSSAVTNEHSKVESSKYLLLARKPRACRVSESVAICSQNVLVRSSAVCNILSACTFFPSSDVSPDLWTKSAQTVSSGSPLTLMNDVHKG